MESHTWHVVTTASPSRSIQALVSPLLRPMLPLQRRNNFDSHVEPMVLNVVSACLIRREKKTFQIADFVKLANKIHYIFIAIPQIYHN